MYFSEFHKRATKGVHDSHAFEDDIVPCAKVLAKVGEIENNRKPKLQKRRRELLLRPITSSLRVSSRSGSVSERENWILEEMAKLDPREDYHEGGLFRMSFGAWL